MKRVDVLVVGGGPAGCLAARELARAGTSVLLVERSSVPRWKVCGACVGPGALSVLEDVGLGRLPGERGAIELGGLVLEGGKRRAALRLGRSVAWSRAAMDVALLRAAERSGAVCWTRALVRGSALEGETRVVRVVRDGEETEVRASVVVDAAGLGGTPDDRAAERVVDGARIGLGAVLEGGALRRRAEGLEGDGFETVPEGTVRMVVGRTGYVGMVRLEDGTLDVAAAVDASTLRSGGPRAAVDAILAEADLDLTGRVVHGWRGTPALHRAPGRVSGPRLFRIGDAMGYVEPFTGEGMGWALASARAVVPYASRGARAWSRDLERGWERYARAELEGERRLCRWIARGLRYPALVDVALAVLSRAPIVAEPVVRRLGRVPRPTTRSFAG
ncbi:MAG: NAD(P)/FAD-dependent oxidoreductase [Myxococcota bacterium]